MSAALFGAHWLLDAAARGLTMLSPQLFSETPPLLFEGLRAAAETAGMAAGLSAGVFVVGGIAAAAAFVWAIRRGRLVSRPQFHEFVRREVLEGRMDPGTAGLIRVYQPVGRFDLSFGAHMNGRVYLRPELAASPALFRTVLAHELEHLRDHRTRAPPTGRLSGLWRRLSLELKARWKEVRAAETIRSFKVPAFERALDKAQLSLRRDAPYDVLVLNPTSGELREPETYRRLSDGKARVETVETGAPASVLDDPRNEGRFMAVVADRPAGILPKEGTTDSQKLEKVLQSLDDLYILATRLKSRDNPFPEGSKESIRFLKLAEFAGRITLGDRKSLDRFERQVRLMWRDVARTRMEGLAVNEYITSLFKSLSDKGTAFLAFQPEDRGVEVWEKLLKFWEPVGGGYFKVTRVDLEDGGHILVARKRAGRVGMWIRPRAGSIPSSIERVASSPDKARRAREMLEAAGLGEQLEKLDALGAEIQDVYGADVGRQEIYVTVPRNRTSAVKRFGALSALAVTPARAGYEPYLMDSPELQEVPPVWRAGFTGRGGKILLIGTGGDVTHEDFGGRLDVVDRVGEGPEDWIGHETVTSSIALGNGRSYLGRIAGLAKSAAGIVSKVFSQDSLGASDGDIKGSILVALERGVDVINVSLGTRGNSGDDLSRFLSDVSVRRNSKGEHIIVAGSFGNAGPFDKTGSQPASGEHVIATAAAAKSVDDGVPEVSFYSSVGPDVDSRYAVKRVRLKPDLTAIGGDVVTHEGDPDPYKDGVTAAKSAKTGSSPSDSKDGRHARMSGTSMASPMVAGAALLLKLAMKAAGTDTPFIQENLPLAVRAILMRTSKDMRVPAWFQGAGLMDAWEAARMVGAHVARSWLFQLKKMWAKLWGRPPPSAEASWEWIARLKNLMELEDKVYSTVEVGRDEPEVSIEEESGAGRSVPLEEEEVPAPADALERFNEAKGEAMPAVIRALRDPVWVVRRQAVLMLLNFKERIADMDLAEVALNDSDRRVRSLAFMALAETPSHRMDELLAKAAAERGPETAVYAAYALARHGDGSAVDRLERELASPDKRLRFTVVWLMGHIARRLGSRRAELLSARAADLSERGNIRHLAVASLVNVTQGKSSAISDKVILDLLGTGGPGNMALTRTISRFFANAMQHQDLRARMRAGALKKAITGFVQRHRTEVYNSGGMGDMVRLFSRHLDIALDDPTPVPHPQGNGVEGVDPALGAVDFIVSRADGGSIKSDSIPAEVLARLEAEVKSELSLSGALRVSVPEHKMYAFAHEMKSLGLDAARSAPLYSTGGRPALTVFRGSESRFVPLDADASPSRILDGTVPSSILERDASGGVSEARVMAALEKVYAEVRDPLAEPTVVAVGVGGTTSSQRPLHRLIDRLVSANIGVVTGAGNEGPGPGTLASPARSRLAVVVAALGPEDAPEIYSGRGEPDEPRIDWSERSGGDGVGTGAAAVSSARKLSLLAEKMLARARERGERLPDGYFLYLVELIKRSLVPLPGTRSHEVGAGLFSDTEAAESLLEVKLGDGAMVSAQAAELMEHAEPGPALTKELRQVLGDGTMTDAGAMRPFVFRTAKGSFRARSAGLEGFLYSKLELEKRGLKHNLLDDYFAYVEALLSPFSWTQGLLSDVQSIRRSRGPDREKDARLNAFLLSNVGGLRSLLASHWGREAGVYMVLSRAYNRLRPGKGFFDSLDDAELDRIVSETGSDTLWVLDMFEIGEINRWGTGGGSPYAIKGYHVKPELGGDAAFKRFVERAHAKGLKVVVDYVANHTSLDSSMVAEHPEAFLHLVPPQPEPGEDLEVYRNRILAQLSRDHAGTPLYYLIETDNYPEGDARVKKHILIHHPYQGGGFPILWVDMAQIDYTHPAARQSRLAEARGIFERFGVDGVRRDMAYFVLNKRFYDHWHGTLSWELSRAGGWLEIELRRALQGLDRRQRDLGDREYLEEMMGQITEVEPSAFVFDEVYDNFDEVSRTGSHAIYNKMGLYDALVSGDARRIRENLKEAAFRDWQTGAAGFVNFIGTHDGGEGNPVDKFGRRLKAAALVALAVRPLLVYNGLEQGVGQAEGLIGDLAKSRDREKAIPFDIPVKIDWSKSDPETSAYMKLLWKKGVEYRELLKNGVMDVLEPGQDTGIVAWSIGSHEPGKKLIMAANFAEGHARGVFSFPALLKSFGAFSPKADRDYILADLANPAADGLPTVYRRSGKSLMEEGLHIELGPGRVHLFEVHEVDASPSRPKPGDDI